MLYGIYFIKHYFFRIIHVNNFILCQLRPAPTTNISIFSKTGYMTTIFFDLCYFEI